MGCDIHGWVEAKIGDKWVAITELYSDGRNYERFAALAGVRGDGPEPKGIPDDISDTVKYWIDFWSGDGHSHTWFPIKEAAKIFLNTKGRSPTENEIMYPFETIFNIDVDALKQNFGVSKKNIRLVIWFDN